MGRQGLTTTLSWTEPRHLAAFFSAKTKICWRSRIGDLQTGPAFSGVVYAHQLGISIGQAVRDLELIAKILDPDDMQNRVEYLPYS